MKDQFFLSTDGNPREAVYAILRQVWQLAGLGSLIIPRESNPESALLSNPSELPETNPFQPVMVGNAARIVAQTLAENPEIHLGAVLRPCELRALSACAAINELSLANLFIICIDCLGTYPQEEYQAPASQAGPGRHLEQDSLQFARQGGLAAYRFRSACQVCCAPFCQEADLSIGIIGLPVRQAIWISTSLSQLAEILSTRVITDAQTQHTLSVQRAVALERLVQRNSQTRTRLALSLADQLPSSLDELLAQLEHCRECQACLQVCPLWGAGFPRPDPGGSFIREDVIQWILSCAGCGMCEQACPDHFPLRAAFALVRQQLEKELDQAVD